MKPSNIITFAVILLVAIVGVIFVSNGKSNPTPNTQSASILSVLENSFDFGTISMKNGDVSKVFAVKNEGSEPVVINKVYTSCMCTVAKITSASGETEGPFGMPGHGGAASKASIEIKAGETVQVEAIFNPAAHGPSGVGLANRTVYLETNSTQTPKVELDFTAIVTN